MQPFLFAIEWLSLLFIGWAESWRSMAWLTWCASPKRNFLIGLQTFEVRLLLLAMLQYKPLSSCLLQDVKETPSQIRILNQKGFDSPTFQNSIILGKHFQFDCLLLLFCYYSNNWGCPWEQLTESSHFLPSSLKAEVQLSVFKIPLHALLKMKGSIDKCMIQNSKKNALM